MKKTFNPYYIIIVSLFLFFGNVLQSQADMAPRARVCAIKGTVRTTPAAGDTSVCPLTQELDKTECKLVNRTTYIITGPGDWAEIEFPNGTKFKLAPNTKIKIAALNTVYIQSGKSWIKVDAIGPDGEFHIKTPTATTGIRGTEFIVEVENDGASTIKLIEGLIEVTDSNQQSKMNLAAGMQVAIAANSSVLNPGILDIEESDKWWTDWPTLVPIAEKPQGDSPGLTAAGKNPLHPIADSHVYAYAYSNWNKADWGAYQILGAGYHPTGGEKRTFLKFDIGDLRPDEIGRATLRLYHYHTGGSPSLNLGIFEVTENWKEGDGLYKPHSDATDGEICWLNQPGFNEEPVSTFAPGEGTNKWIEVDISQLVRDWAAGMPNHGIVIKAAGSLHNQGESQYGFYSREHEDSDKRPQLVIQSMRKEGVSDAINNKSVCTLALSGVLDDHYNSNSQYKVAISVNGRQVYTAEQTPFEHGKPFGTIFENWKTLKINLDDVESGDLLKVSLTHSGSPGSDWIGVDYIETTCDGKTTKTELAGYPNYGAQDGAAAIVYGGQSKTWTITLP